jgi:NTE family protein
MVQLKGTAVTVLGPGPEDLQLMGYNLMAPERRRVVLESAVRTGMVAFADPPVVEPSANGPDQSLIALDFDVNRSEHG